MKLTILSSCFLDYFGVLHFVALSLLILQFYRGKDRSQGPRYDFENGGGGIFERLLGLLSP